MFRTSTSPPAAPVLPAAPDVVTVPVALLVIPVAAVTVTLPPPVVTDWFRATVVPPLTVTVPPSVISAALTVTEPRVLDTSIAAVSASSVAAIRTVPVWLMVMAPVVLIVAPVLSKPVP